MANTLVGSGLGSVTGLTGFVIGSPEATAAERQGDVADPRHADVGEDDSWYPWEVFPGETHGPYGTENGLLGDDINDGIANAGSLAQDPTADMQPVTHAAPWPKGVPTSVLPDEVQARRLESADIHASNQGGSREMLYEPTLNAVQDDWVEMRDTTPGMTFPAMVAIPPQVQTGSAGWGSCDVVQSMARQNGYGFDSAHMHRRYAAGPVPGNFLWLAGAGRPLVKSVPGTAKLPVGGDSPFAGQIPGVAFNPQGSVLGVLPATYSPSPDPALAPAFTASDGSTDLGLDLW